MDERFYGAVSNKKSPSSFHKSFIREKEFPVKQKFEE